MIADFTSNSSFEKGKKTLPHSKTKTKSLQKPSFIKMFKFPFQIEVGCSLLLLSRLVPLMFQNEWTTSAWSLRIYSDLEIVRSTWGKKGKKRLRKQVKQIKLCILTFGQQSVQHMLSCFLQCAGRSPFSKTLTQLDRFPVLVPFLWAKPNFGDTIFPQLSVIIFPRSSSKAAEWTTHITVLSAQCPEKSSFHQLVIRNPHFGVMGQVRLVAWAPSVLAESLSDFFIPHKAPSTGNSVSVDPSLLWGDPSFFFGSLG